MRIKVEQKHIDKGVPMGQDSCPVALALKDKGFRDIRVMSFGTYVNSGYDDERFWFHSAETSEFISNFDNKRPVRPFGFEAR